MSVTLPNLNHSFIFPVPFPDPVLVPDPDLDPVLDFRVFYMPAEPHLWVTHYTRFHC